MFEANSFTLKLGISGDGRYALLGVKCYADYLWFVHREGRKQ